MLAILRQTLSQIDPKNRRSKAQELVDALIAGGIDGDVKATMAILDRIHGKVTPDRPDVLDISELVAEVAARAEKRRLELALMDRKVKLADKQLEGPEDKICLEDVSRAMQARNEEYERERLAEETATAGMNEAQLASWHRARDQALAPRPRSGFVELPPDPPPVAPIQAPEVKPPEMPGVLPGEFWEMPGFGTIKIR